MGGVPGQLLNQNQGGVPRLGNHSSAGEAGSRKPKFPQAERPWRARSRTPRPEPPLLGRAFWEISPARGARSERRAGGAYGTTIESMASAGEPPGRRRRSLYKFGVAGPKVLLLLQQGAFLQEAAAAAGIDRRTIYNWLHLGRRLRRGRVGRWAQAVDQTIALTEIRSLSILRAAAAAGVWQAAAWWLERRFPQRWRRRSAVEHTGPITTETAPPSLTSGEKRARLVELLTRLRAVEAATAAREKNAAEAEHRLLVEQVSADRAS